MARAIVASKKPVWIVLAVALVIHVGLISLQGRRRFDTSFVRVWILDSLTPIEKLVDSAGSGVYSVWSRYIALIGAHDENERLKHENDELRMQIARDHEKVLEAERVTALVGLQDPGLGKTVIARVIGRDTAGRQTVTINKGRTSGVKPDSAVITPAGVVGRVIHSGNFSSIVQLVVIRPPACGLPVLSVSSQPCVMAPPTVRASLTFFVAITPV